MGAGSCLFLILNKALSTEITALRLIVRPLPQPYSRQNPTPMGRLLSKQVYTLGVVPTCIIVSPPAADRELGKDFLFSLDSEKPFKNGFEHGKA